MRFAVELQVWSFWKYPYQNDIHMAGDLLLNKRYLNNALQTYFDTLF